MFASFSIAVVLVPLVSVFRQSVNQAFLPRMSKLQATGNVAGMLELNNQANVIVGTIVYPLLAWVFAFAEEIVAVVYTETYVSAAPVMPKSPVGSAGFVPEPRDAAPYDTVPPASGHRPGKVSVSVAATAAPGANGRGRRVRKKH